MTKEDIIATLWECDLNTDVFRPFVTNDEMKFIADKLHALQPTDKEIDEYADEITDKLGAERIYIRNMITNSLTYFKNFKR